MNGFLAERADPEAVSFELVFTPGHSRGTLKIYKPGGGTTELPVRLTAVSQDAVTGATVVEFGQDLDTG